MKRSNNKIPFGLKNGVLVDVSGVESGLACGCVCPSCHRKLQANRGQIVSHYFSHHPSDESQACESAFETSIHRMAKQLLSEAGHARFPELTVKVRQPDADQRVYEESGLVETESVMNFDRVELEKRLGQIRPDIIAYRDGIPFLIEVAVTHFADVEKKKWIRSQSLAAIEIDLSNVHFAVTKNRLRELVVQDVRNKKWLSNPRALEIKKRLKAELDAKVGKINEGIYKARQHASLDNNQRANSTLAEKRHIRPSVRRRSISLKQYERRTFICEACEHLFEFPTEMAPYTMSTIECPKCGHHVSTKRC